MRFSIIRETVVLLLGVFLSISYVYAASPPQLDCVSFELINTTDTYSRTDLKVKFCVSNQNVETTRVIFDFPVNPEEKIKTSSVLKIRAQVKNSDLKWENVSYSALRFNGPYQIEMKNGEHKIIEITFLGTDSFENKELRLIFGGQSIGMPGSAMRKSYWDGECRSQGINIINGKGIWRLNKNR